MTKIIFEGYQTYAYAEECERGIRQNMNLDVHL